jgi:ornithine cyclodeaminase
VTDNSVDTWTVAGDLLVPLKQGEITNSKLYGELGDVVTEKIPGRENEKELTIYESVGFAALDIAVAVAAYKKLSKSGTGTDVTL